MPAVDFQCPTDGLCDGNDVVDARTEWVGIFQVHIHRLSTDSADTLGGKNAFLIQFKLAAMGPVLVRTIPLCSCFRCHGTILRQVVGRVT